MSSIEDSNDQLLIVYATLGNFSRSWRFMAKREVASEVSEDLRESLIALSYSLPNTELSLTDITKSSNNIPEAVNADENEKVRAELISISYADSPDNKDSPVSPGKTTG